MKTVTVNNRILQYESVCEDGGYDDYFTTNFYEGLETYTYRKYWLWGPKISGVRPKFLFNIPEDCDNQRLTKEWWRGRISHELELLNRKQQLEKGELI